MILNAIYQIPLRGGDIIARAVNGEVHFNEPGLSHGWVHFAHPVTGAKLGFSGVAWFDQHATLLEH